MAKRSVKSESQSPWDRVAMVAGVPGVHLQAIPRKSLEKMAVSDLNARVRQFALEILVTAHLDGEEEENGVNVSMGILRKASKDESPDVRRMVLQGIKGLRA